MDSQFKPKPPSEFDLSAPAVDALSAAPVAPAAAPVAPAPAPVAPAPAPVAPAPAPVASAAAPVASAAAPVAPAAAPVAPAPAPTAPPAGRPPVTPVPGIPYPAPGTYPGPGIPYHNPNPAPIPRPAPASTPKPTPAPTPKPAKKGPGMGARIILRCTAVLLSIFLFFTLLTGIVIYDGKELLDPENLYTLLASLEADDYEDNELLLALQDEMVYWVNELFVHEYGSYYEFDRDEVVEFLEESSINQFLAEKAAGYVRDILEDTRKTKVTTKELKKLYKENKDLMEDKLDIRISSEIDRQVQQNLARIDVNAMIEENLFDYIEAEGGIDDDVQDVLEMTSAIFSDNSFIICIVIAAILAIALVLCNRLRPAGSLTHIGLPAFLAGGIMLLPVLLLNTVFDGVIDAMELEMTRDAEKAMGLLLSECGDILTPAALIITIIGVVFLIAAPITKLIFKKK